MARVALNVTTVPLNGGTVVNGGSIIPADGLALQTKGSLGDVLIHVNNTGVAGTISVEPGDRPPSALASLGTAAITIGGTADLFLRLEAARFMQSDGTILMNFSANMAGFVKAYSLR